MTLIPMTTKEPWLASSHQASTKEFMLGTAFEVGNLGLGRPKPNGKHALVSFSLFFLNKFN
jgi:hypothetical protein